jgi:hypothetical protein
MRHVGEKLRLMPVGRFNERALCLDFPKEPSVLNR